jgi:hypothetical protein
MRNDDAKSKNGEGKSNEIRFVVDGWGRAVLSKGKNLVRGWVRTHDRPRAKQRNWPSHHGDHTGKHTTLKFGPYSILQKFTKTVLVGHCGAAHTPVFTVHLATKFSKLMNGARGTRAFSVNFFASDGRIKRAGSLYTCVPIRTQKNQKRIFHQNLRFLISMISSQPNVQYGRGSCLRSKLMHHTCMLDHASAHEYSWVSYK